MTLIRSKIYSIKTLASILDVYADSFSFTCREGIPIPKKLENLLDDLSPYLIEKKEVMEWPGTKLLLDKAALYLFDLNTESAFILSQYDDYIFNWIQPELPEDVVFYQNEHPIFISITHERDAYFELNEKIEKFISNKISLYNNT